MAGRGDA